MSEPRTCWRCGEKPATICTTCQGDLAAYYDQQIENLTTPLAQAAPELLAALRGLLALVRDTIATADDLHEVHAADAALARAEAPGRKEEV